MFYLGIDAGAFSVQLAVMSCESKIIYRAERAHNKKERKPRCSFLRKHLIRSVQMSLRYVPAGVLPGKGVMAKIEGKKVCTGNDKLIGDDTASVCGDVRSLAAEHLDKGATVIYVTVDGELSGMIALCDTPRKDSRDMIESLKALGIVHNAGSVFVILNSAVLLGFKDRYNNGYKGLVSK